MLTMIDSISSPVSGTDIVASLQPAKDIPPQEGTLQTSLQGRDTVHSLPISERRSDFSAETYARCIGCGVITLVWQPYVYARCRAAYRAQDH